MDKVENISSKSVKAMKARKRSKAKEMAAAVGIAKKREKVKKEVVQTKNSETAITTTKKWRQRGRRVFPVTQSGGSSSTAPVALSTFSLFNCDVEFRVCGTIVMFKTEDVLALTKTALGLNTEVGKSSPVGAVLKHLRTASKYELLLQDQDQSWLRTHISWKAYRDLVNDAVMDIALRELLNSYVPFESRKKRLPRDDGSNQGPTLEQDCLKLAGVTVPFVVHRGRIFLDLLASFTVLGQLRLAFMNSWDKVDRILEEQGLNQKDAFRRNHKSRAKERKWNSQRSHITFRAVKVLAENLVDEPARKRALVQLFAHLETEIGRVGNMKQTLLDQMEVKVKKLLTHVGQLNSSDSNFLIKKSELSPLSNGEEELVGTELCDSGCGRQYHFTIRCCSKSHQINLAGKAVGYIVNKGRIFLEKCGAFSCLGRMYVIRCSDYRRSDKTLSSFGLKPKRHYLYESQTSPDQNLHYRRRNRRTHISFEAFATLVKAGFADQARNKELLEAVQQVNEKSEELKVDCLRYLKPKLEDDDLLNNKQDSSSGIESGSSHSGSGTNSPISFDEKLSETEIESSPISPDKNGKVIAPLRKIKVAGQSINTYVQMDQLYLSVSDVCQCFGSGKNSLARFKRFSRSLDLVLCPPFKKMNGKHFISHECLLQLVDKKRVIPVSKEFEEEIRELQKMDEKKNESTADIKPSMDEACSSNTPPVKMENEDDDDESFSKVSSKINSSNENPTVKIMGMDVAARVVNNCVYLEKKSVFKILNITSPSHIAYRAIDKALEQGKVCVDDSFLYEGRRRSFMSTKALRVLAENDVEKSTEINATLDDLDSRCESLKVNRVLKLSDPFNDINMKVVGDTVFLSTVHFLTAVGFKRSYMLPNPSKAYFVLVRLLKRRGLNTSACFLKWGKSKYAHISVYGAMTLFKTEFGPFRDKNRVDRLRNEILSALKENGLTYQDCAPEMEKRKSSSASSDEGKMRSDPNFANLSDKFPPIRFQIKDNVIFLHRKTCFEAIGVERALLSSTRGYAAINNILVCGRVDLKQCYIRGKQEQYAFISLQAIFVLLDSEDPLFACLEKKEAFLDSLFSWISCKVANVLSTTNDFPLEGFPSVSVPFKSDQNRLYFHRRTSFKISGLFEKRASGRIVQYPAIINEGDNLYQDELPDESFEAVMRESPTAMIIDRGLDLSKVGFLPDDTGPYGYISVDTLLLLTRLDGEITRASDYHKLIWKDMIHAVLHEVPKLRIHVKMIEFREAVLTSLLNLLRTALENSLRGDDKMSIDRTMLESDVVRSSVDNLAPPCVKASCLTPKFFGKEEVDSSIETEREEDDVMDESLNSSEEDPLFIPKSAGSLILTKPEFDLALSQVYGNSTLGDWTVKYCSDSELWFSVNPGYGASKKPSFTQPDVWAMLSYDLRLKPDSPPELSINGHKVPDESLRSFFTKSVKKGVFNLLYTLLMLRPCFGCFNPELVETFKKGDDGKFAATELTVDSKFIGSSQSGRTYAGCVRHKQCSILADSRVSDTCRACSNLRNIVINRSVLTSPDYQSSPTDESRQQQQTQLSVWKVEETSVNGCTFLCPQLQSFNTSLPHQFKTSQQATSVVSHRVYISNDLEIKISLNGSTITSKTFPGEFSKNKQVGPLLDWVASLRLCIGYPDTVLVERARYLTLKKHLLPPETRKFFDYILVDEIFEWKRMNSATSDGSSNVGTLRTPSCRYVAGDFADICDQCRLLQEPLEFLGVKKL